MGSWNKSCALSGLSIGSGDPVVVLLMESTCYSEGENKFGTPGKILKFYPGQDIFPSESGLLGLVFLPIFGTYEDYGHLDFNLNDNPHLRDVNDTYYLTGLIEPQTSSYEDITKQENNDRDFPNGLFAVWIHKDIWDSVVKHYDTQPTKEHGTFYSSTMLEALGFVESGKTGLDRYDTLYTKLNWGRYAIACDGSFGEVVEYKDNAWHQLNVICTHPELIVFAKKHKLPLDDTGINWRLLTIKNLIREIRDSWTPPSRKWYATEWGWLNGGGSTYQNFCNLWAQKLLDEDPDVTEVMSQFYVVKLFFYMTGRLMIPTHNGPQCGEPDYSLVLAKATADVAKAKIKERKKYR